MKLRQFMTDLKKARNFVEVIAYQVSVELQKHGMAYDHILLTLADKFQSAEDVDNCISATIPPIPAEGEDEYDKKRRLHEYVAKFMIHGSSSGLYKKRKKDVSVIGRINARIIRPQKAVIGWQVIESFECAGTVNGVAHKTFMEAAKAAGLIEDSNEWDLCL
ncbi:hypothetical protein OESDEN_08773 [Oesophagostomum dentatum]|uniref:Uncharacterized protein n=1 Tax=Oesophagostomum dentatum TaxID=61180 RepID=A0A0B1T7J6_OESDE|nr:hypothetical protein OESDEN_08773 [Oesophagostomum dentatum]